jgi:hypothetical protein
MTLVTIDAGTLQASQEERTLTGLLVPYGEECRSNLGRFTINAGAISIPEDLTGLSLNVEHEREAVVGGFLQARETPEGIVATFSVAKTPEGDKALADVESGNRRHLSVEAKDVIIRDGKAISGRLFAGALVKTPAFPSAVLLAAAADTEDLDMDQETTTPQETTETTVEEFTDENGQTWVKKTTEDIIVDGTTTTTVTTEVVEEPEPQAQSEGDDGMNTAAAVPGALQASAPITTNDRPSDKMSVFASIAQAVSTQDRSLLAALADVKYDGAGAFGQAAQVPDYVGQVWDGKRFQRKIIPLVGSGQLTSMKIQGFRYVTKPVVAPWAGNKSDVPTNAPSLEAAEWTAQRFAGAWDIAREFVDFGQTAIIEDFLSKAADSYAKVTDEAALTGLLAEAEVNEYVAITGSDLVTEPAIGQLVQGAMSVLANDATPTFAVVAPDVFNRLALIKQNNALELLSMGLGLEAGSLAGFSITPHAGMTPGSVLVGDREAARVYELAGSPIRVNALEIAKGGIDEALFGYMAVRVDYAEGLQLVLGTAGEKTPATSK